MKKIIRNIAFGLTLTLLLNIFSPLAGFAKTNELKETQTEYSYSSEDLQMNLDLISNNYDLFVENDDLEVVKSYNIEDKDVALLNYYLENIISESTLNNQNANLINSGASIQDTEASVYVWGILVKFVVEQSIKKKMGKRILDDVGDQMADKKVVEKAKEATAKAVDKYGYNGKKTGPESPGAINGINQGEHILELRSLNNQPFFKLHVFKNDSGNQLRFH